MLTIRARLTLSVLGLIVGLVGLLTYYQTVQLRSFLDEQAVVRIRAQAKPILDAYVEARSGSPAVPLGAEAGRLATELTSADTGAVVLDQAGAVLGRPAEGSIGTAPPDDVPADAVARAAAGEREVDVLREGGAGRELVALVPLRSSTGTPPAVIALVTGLTGEEAIAGQQVAASLIGLGATTALAALIGPLIVRRSLRPLGRIAATAQRVAAGDLSQRLNMAGQPDEIRVLAAAFDSMTAELELAFAELARSDVRSRAFVADASHELKTPLTTIAGFADLMIRHSEHLDPDEQLRLTASLRREIGRAQRMVASLLLLARMDAGQDLPTHAVALRAVCESVVEQVAAAAEDRVLRVVGDATVEADEDRVRQVLLNLLGNALRHTAARTGRIEVLIERDDGIVELSVVDNGSGMDEATRRVALDRFARGRAPVGEGSGLGLPIVASIAQSLHGSVSVRSHPGEGTTVTVSLPAGGSA